MLLNLFKKIPESDFKAKLRCFISNNFYKHEFKVYYLKNKYHIKFKKFELVFHDNPFEGLFSIQGYFKLYKPCLNDIVIDAGAYNGVISLYMSKLVGKHGKVIAFEPDTLNYEKLKKNIKLNNAKNIILLNKGLWSKNTVLLFENKHASGSKILLNSDSKEEIIKIETVNLDNEIKRLNIKKINYIKMDIEGAEIEAVRGAKKTLKKNDVHLSIASYHIVNGVKTCFEVEKELKKQNYKTKTEMHNQLLTFGFKK